MNTVFLLIESQFVITYLNTFSLILPEGYILYKTRTISGIQHFIRKKITVHVFDQRLALEITFTNSGTHYAPLSQNLLNISAFNVHLSYFNWFI